MKNEVREKIKKYKELKADIVDINIRIAEMERDYIGITAIPQGERISPTYKITSSVESQAEKHMEEVEKLLHMRFIKENKIKRIENALGILNDEERDIIEMVVINQKKYSALEIKYNISYSRIKQIESKALNKVARYLI